MGGNRIFSDKKMNMHYVKKIAYSRTRVQGKCTAPINNRVVYYRTTLEDTQNQCHQRKKIDNDLNNMNH